MLFGSCHLILFVSSTYSFQIVRRQCCPIKTMIFKKWRKCPGAAGGVSNHRCYLSPRWCIFFQADALFAQRFWPILAYFGQFGLFCCKFTHFFCTFTVRNIAVVSQNWLISSMVVSWEMPKRIQIFFSVGSSQTHISKFHISIHYYPEMSRFV